VCISKVNKKKLNAGFGGIKNRQTKESPGRSLMVAVGFAQS
jgi:hypothetical protein